jgi:serine phosphatase RsbU (regulator of sigma subunit)
MNPPASLHPSDELDQLPLEQQVIRLQALLEASRAVHSTIELPRVLEQAARIAVLELELNGAYFTQPHAGFGRIPAEPDPSAPTIPLLARDGAVLSELVLVLADGHQLSIYERDFLEGLALQTALAVENAMHHQRRLEWARLEQDLDAARTIQRSLLPQSLPAIAGYSLGARSSACYQVGGDYLDLVSGADGSQLIVVADVAGKGLASALMCTSFRSAFRALAREGLPLEELAGRLGQQHWEEGVEARRRYVTAIFARLDPATGLLEFINAGHNPGCLLGPGADGAAAQTINASGPPLGLLPGCGYTAEQVVLPPGGRLLLYTDGLTEVFQGDEEFGEERLFKTFAHAAPGSADGALETLWTTLTTFSGGAPQVDDMSAVALYRLGGRGEAS